MQYPSVQQQVLNSPNSPNSPNCSPIKMWQDSPPIHHQEIKFNRNSFEKIEQENLALVTQINTLKEDLENAIQENVIYALIANVIEEISKRRK